jgi:uncharacterized protein
VIQVAVGCVHHQRGNVAGAISLLGRAADRLRPYPDVHRGVDVEQLIVFCEGAVAVMRETGECFEIGYPEFPAMDDGPWFTPDAGALEPPAGPTPIPDEPVWLAAGRPRTPRRRETER